MASGQASMTEKESWASKWNTSTMIGLYTSGEFFQPNVSFATPLFGVAVLAGVILFAPLNFSFDFFFFLYLVVVFLSLLVDT